MVRARLRRNLSYKTHRVSAVDAVFLVAHAAIQRLVKLSRRAITYTKRLAPRSRLFCLQRLP
jgi:hypothetical protein